MTHEHEGMLQLDQKNACLRVSVATCFDALLQTHIVLNESVYTKNMLHTQAGALEAESQDRDEIEIWRMKVSTTGGGVVHSVPGEELGEDIVAGGCEMSSHAFARADKVEGSAHKQE